MNFETFNFHPSVMSGVTRLGYTIPTPIQVQAIPPVLKGHDVIGLAQTGTGKTAAFVLPMLHRLTGGPRGVVRALIVSPTRELVEQTCDAISELGKDTGFRSLAVYGGASMEHQVSNLRNRTEIVVACPGRLLDHLWKGSVDLSHVEILVIDEADRMLDMGFLPDIRNILRCMLNKRQTLMFSATMPTDIRRLAGEILEEPVTVQVGRTAPASTVSHTIYNVNQEMKTSLLLNLLREIQTESVLVFTRTKHRTERVAEQLQRAGFKTASLQGNLSQNRRDYAIDGFRSGNIKILVATDIAARGIDVSSISHVINYDMPENVDAYTHRIGRTGRVEKKGDAFTFATSADKAMVHQLEIVLKDKLEKRHVDGFSDKASARTSAPKREQNRRPARRTQYRRTRREPITQKAS
jgi:ATP-dependent RNA helicase RhlE